MDMGQTSVQDTAGRVKMLLALISGSYLLQGATSWLREQIMGVRDGIRPLWYRFGPIWVYRLTVIGDLEESWENFGNSWLFLFTSLLICVILSLHLGGPMFSTFVDK